MYYKYNFGCNTYAFFELYFCSETAGEEALDIDLDDN